MLRPAHRGTATRGRGQSVRRVVLATRTDTEALPDLPRQDGGADDRGMSVGTAAGAPSDEP